MSKKDVDNIIFSHRAQIPELFQEELTVIKKYKTSDGFKKYKENFAKNDENNNDDDYFPSEWGALENYTNSYRCF